MFDYGHLALVNRELFEAIRELQWQWQPRVRGLSEAIGSRGTIYSMPVESLLRYTVKPKPTRGLAQTIHKRRYGPLRTHRP